jgi:archaeosine-15-forming tRNA-guanine transglycosylase
MQELTNSIKRPNLRIMGINEGEEVQAKGMCNIFNKIITENFPNIAKTMPI